MSYDNSPILLFIILFFFFFLFTNPWAVSTVKVRFYQFVYNSPPSIRKLFFRDKNGDKK